jgi:hypothetical protein
MMVSPALPKFASRSSPEISSPRKGSVNIHPVIRKDTVMKKIAAVKIPFKHLNMVYPPF